MKSFRSVSPLFEEGVRGSLLLLFLFFALSLHAQVVTVYKAGKAIGCFVSPDSMMFSDTYPDFAASTVFAVSDTSYVHFSKGNLQYQASTDTWRFADRQYDYVGDGNANISDTTYTGWIDLFCWATGDDPTFVGDFDNYKTVFVDWGINVIGTDTANTWRTLTPDEWQYLFQHTHWTMATVNDTLGLMFLPTHFETPEGLTLSILGGGNLSDYRLNFAESDYATNVYTASDFARLESMGVVFLPCAGDRGLLDDQLRIYNCGVYGFYWAATPVYTNLVQYFLFGQKTACYTNHHPQMGMSVRLVKDVPFNNQ